VQPALLFIFAHPDDESFSGAGTAMKYAAEGAKTVLVTATMGDKGKAGDPPVCAPQDLAKCREQELREAAKIIGFDELHLLDYRDGELSAAPPDVLRQRLVTIIRRLRPTVVFTFDPNGFNEHPDHVAISRFTSDAVAAAADPRWVRAAGAPHTVPRVLWTPPIGPTDAVKHETLGTQPGIDFMIDVSAWRDRRAGALRAHRSQHLSVDKYFFSQPDVDRILGTEFWRLGWGTPPRERPAYHILST
jgi:LmbE family N-acetylglucosaminyl deacetylase